MLIIISDLMKVNRSEPGEQLWLIMVLYCLATANARQ